MDWLNKSLLQPTERVAEGIGLVLIVIGCLVDLYTGPDYSPLLFYVVPIIYVGWFSSRQIGWAYVLLIAASSVAVSIVEEKDYFHSAGADFNTATRIITIALAYWLVRRFQVQVVRLRALRDQLSRVNRNKDLLLRIIGHDLAGNFNTILGFTGLLRRRVASLSPEKTQEYADAVDTAARAAFDTLDDLRNWAQLQTDDAAPQGEICDIVSIVSRAADRCRSAAQAKGVELVCDCGTPDLQVFGNRTAIDTVLRNLLSNAVKFTPAGGRVTVSARPTADMMEVSVTDSGVGIASERLAGLLMPEERSHTLGTDREPGAGIGLSLSRDLVQRIGGTLKVDSVEGKGSRFSFTIPRYA